MSDISRKSGPQKKKKIDDYFIKNTDNIQNSHQNLKPNHNRSNESKPKPTSSEKKQWVVKGSSKPDDSKPVNNNNNQNNNINNTNNNNQSNNNNNNTNNNNQNNNTNNNNQSNNNNTNNNNQNNSNNTNNNNQNNQGNDIPEWKKSSSNKEFIEQASYFPLSKLKDMGPSSIEPLRMTRPPKFEAEDKQALEYLDKFGYVVFKNMATPSELNTATDLFWNWMSLASGNKCKRNDPETWMDSVWPCGRPGTGIFHEHGVGQSHFLWYCRTLPNIRKAFSNVWDDEDDLIVSFDGCGAFRPPEYLNSFKTKTGWYHVDQNGLNKKGKRCVQGLFNLIQSHETDGGITLLPRSQLLFDHLFQADKRKPKKDFYMIPKMSKIFHLYELLNMKMEKICLDPGDFIMWDSRVVHCNSPASTKASFTVPSTQKPGLRRLVAYICMLPTRFVSHTDIIRQRIEGVKKGTTTNHWPNEFSPASQNDMKAIRAPPLSEDQILLVTGKRHRALWKDHKSNQTNQQNQTNQSNQQNSSQNQQNQQDSSPNQE